MAHGTRRLVPLSARHVRHCRNPRGSRADEAYGQCRALRAWLEEHQVRYVLTIPKDEVLPLSDGRTRQARELWALVPEDAFERRSCADGAKVRASTTGPLSSSPPFPRGWSVIC